MTNFKIFLCFIMQSGVHISFSHEHIFFIQMTYTGGDCEFSNTSNGYLIDDLKHAKNKNISHIYILYIM